MIVTVVTKWRIFKER